jgi:hypothetical protein
MVKRATHRRMGYVVHLIKERPASTGFPIGWLERGYSSCPTLWCDNKCPIQNSSQIIILATAHTAPCKTLRFLRLCRTVSNMRSLNMSVPNHLSLLPLQRQIQRTLVPNTKMRTTLPNTMRLRYLPRHLLPLFWDK